tara:strand:- start:440 stop:847 length:408 start_codon:yes stop_codon:yes gene_type:complete
MKFHTNSTDQNDATRSTAMASFHDARDTKMSTKQTDYMKLRIIFTEVYYDDQVIDGEPEWHYNPREYTAHIQIVRDEEKRLHMNTRQYLDHVTDKAELILDSFLFKTLIADGYFHWAYSHPGGKSTQQWTIIKLD